MTSMWCQRQYNKSVAVSPFTEMDVLHFSGMNSNAGGACCLVHANNTIPPPFCAL